MSGQSAEGDVATETIRCFGRDGRSEIVAPGFVFGCARRAVGFNVLENSPVSGIMGVSFAPESIVSQLDGLANRRFSYCLFPLSLGMQAQSTLSFGDAVPTPPANALVTPILRHPGPHMNYIYLDLRDISVGSRRLGFPPGTFGISGDSDGFIIDSGTAVTLLAETGINPFHHVITAFREFYDSKEGLVRIEVSEMGLCYSYPDGFEELLSMTYHFAGADLYVDGVDVHFHGNMNGKYFCVGVMGGAKNSILGAVHQQNTRFIFDGHVDRLQFYSDVCS